MHTCSRCKIEQAYTAFNGSNKTCTSCGERFKCPHKKQKYTCYECSPHLFCTAHGKVILKTNCNECSPHLFCKDHGETIRVKNKCPDCNPKVKCEHGNVKYNCQTCGKKKCPNHPDRYYYTCKDCGGGAFCKEHPTEWKDICKLCVKVTGRCEHSRIKKNCAECGGSKVCEHNILRYSCKECKGSGICEHNRQKASCRDCGGSAICEHDKVRQGCIKCTPSAGCQHCHYVKVNKTSRSYPYCFSCFCVLHPEVELPRQFKIKETHVRDFLKEEFKEDITMIFDKKVADGCSRRRPDVLIDFGTHLVILECDENEHKNYDCERKRMTEIYEDCGFRPIVFLRFNPDAYEADGKTYGGCFKLTKTVGLKVEEKEFKKRMKEIVKRIEHYRVNAPEGGITTEYFFYSKILEIE